MLMEPLPFAQLPGTNALFLDFVNHPERVGDLYPHDKTIPDPHRAHRAQLCEVLKRQNEAIGNPHTHSLIEKLSKADAYCVITGQQVGLLTGPMYTLWKALTAIQHAARSENEGLSCIPVFWLASEDHNWHEISNFALLRPSMELMQFSLKEHLFVSRQPTGAVPVDHPEMRKILLRALRESSVPAVKEYYSRGTLAGAFSRTLLWLMKDFPMLIINPADPDFKRIAEPFFRKFFDRNARILSELQKQNEDLRSRHYPVQVQIEEGSLPMFSIDKSERSHLKANGDYTKVDVDRLSPAALLRPLFQDFIFPTLAYVGGPAEIAYFAQLHRWYEIMDMQQPRLLARASVTLIPQVTRSFLEEKNLHPWELFLKEDALFDALMNNKGLEQTRREVRDLSEHINKSFEKIENYAASIDVTLKKAVGTAQRKINYQLNKTDRKTFLAAKRKNQILGEQIRKARNVIYPSEKLQERYLNIFSFAPRLPELIGAVYGRINWDLQRHQWIEI